MNTSFSFIYIPLQIKENEHDLLSSPLLSSPRFASAAFTLDQSDEPVSFELLHDGNPTVYLQFGQDQLVWRVGESSVLESYKKQQGFFPHYETIAQLKQLAIKTVEQTELNSSIKNHQTLEPNLLKIEDIFASLSERIRQATASKTHVKQGGYRQIVYFNPNPDPPDAEPNWLEKLREKLFPQPELVAGSASFKK